VHIFHNATANARDYEGEEIEVTIVGYHWRRAKIVRIQEHLYCVEFPGGRRDVFKATNIRAIEQHDGFEAGETEPDETLTYNFMTQDL
jgi:hypothetical protein